LKDIEQSVKLEENASFTGLYDPTKEVSVSETEQGWARYKFRFLADDGRIVSMSGGTRLFDEIVRVCGNSDKPRRLKITATGKAGTTDRKFSVQEVPMKQ
jgi:hypothetical protein